MIEKVSRIPVKAVVLIVVLVTAAVLAYLNYNKVSEYVGIAVPKKDCVSNFTEVYNSTASFGNDPDSYCNKTCFDSYNSTVFKAEIANKTTTCYCDINRCVPKAKVATGNSTGTHNATRTPSPTPNQTNVETLTSIESIIKNPANYSTKTVTINGELWAEFPPGYNTYSPDSCKRSSFEEELRDCTAWYLSDSQGYRIKVVKNQGLIGNRSFVIGFNAAYGAQDYDPGTYRFKGQILYATVNKSYEKELSIKPTNITLAS